MSDENNGWEIPIHLSLTAKPLTFGLQRDFSILLWSIALMLAIHMWMIHIIPIAAFLHGAIAYFTRQDPYFIECLSQSFKYQRFYE